MKILVDDEFTDRARDLLKAGFHQRGHCRDNPVTGTTFVHGLDPIVWQIRDAARALRARDRFAREHPGLPLLPLNYADRERAKSGPGRHHVEHALSWFARSLEAHRYDLDRHPAFEDYVRGVLCDLRLRELFKPIVHLYPPKPLPGLVPGFSYWGPPDRPGYLDQLVLANKNTGMPEWPAGWLLPDQMWFAEALQRRELRRTERP